MIIDNIFQIQNGDIMQICEDGIWTDLGVIKNSREAAKDMNKNNFTLMNKPARIVRRP